MGGRGAKFSGRVAHSGDFWYGVANLLCSTAGRIVLNSVLERPPDAATFPGINRHCWGVLLPGKCVFQVLPRARHGLELPNFLNWLARWC